VTGARHETPAKCCADFSYLPRRLVAAAARPQAVTHRAADESLCFWAAGQLSPPRIVAIKGPLRNAFLTVRPPACRNYHLARAEICCECPLSTCAVTRRRLSSGCKAHPAIAPAESNRGRHGGDEMSEAPG